MKKWNILATEKEITISEALIQILLTNRGLVSKKEIDSFLNPNLADVTVESVVLDQKELKKALKRIKNAIAKKEQIVVFGDYDVDGICGTAILWETLYKLKANAMPYIPHRIDEGYGLSMKGIDHVLELYPKTALIITIDNGIVASSAVDYANEKKIDVMITDHHVPPAGGSENLPKAQSIVHTTKLCGTGVAYLLSEEIKKLYPEVTFQGFDTHLELVALATIADLVPLTGANRTLTKFGLEMLTRTKRIGLIELFKEATINPKEISTYHVGHLISPRLNAMGRLEYAMESLRLLCTNNLVKAQELAMRLGSTNRERQQITLETVQHASSFVKEQKLESAKLLFIAHKDYQPGVIGLVAGRLVEEYYRPSIVLSIGETYAKASARSISGFNIIEFIRSGSEFLVDAGGHPMAAGFTVEIKNLEKLQRHLEKKADELLTDDMFEKIIKIDAELSLSFVTQELFDAIKKLSPFGMGNPEPVFVSKNVLVKDIRSIGKDNKHLKLVVTDREKTKSFDAIAFGMGDLTKTLKVGDTIDIAYTIDENTWNGNTKLQLKIRDIKLGN